MNAPPPGDAPPSSPYRVYPPLPVEPPPPRSSLASHVLSACALMATLTSLHLSYSVARLATAIASPRVLTCAAAPRPFVDQVPLPATSLAPSTAVAPVEPPAPALRATTRGVRALGRGVYVVSRRAIDGALESRGGLGRRTRIVPEIRDGRTVGVRVFGIHQGDSLSSLGFADGDVILRVNDVEVASPDRCLEAYARLRAADQLTVSFERRGRVRSHVYAIVAEL